MGEPRLGKDSGDVSQEAAKQQRSRHKAKDFIEAALGICERDGSEFMTARRVAKEMGLSPMALYRHFKSMDHLQTLVWNEGFARLQAAVYASMSDAPNKLKALCRVMKTHVEFGVTHPGLYRYMFAAGSQPERYGEKNLGIDALKHLTRLIVEAQRTSSVSSDADPHELALHIWFVVHGLTTAAISGQVRRVTNLDLDELISKTTERVVRAL